MSIRFGLTSVPGEIESETGELGQIKQLDGTFITPPPDPPTYEEERAKYIRLIQEAQLLGEIEEVTRLQTEWQQVKATFA